MSEKLNLIKKLSFFNSLNDDQLDIVDAISKVSNYAKNSVLYYENDRNNKIFFLISGLIKVYKIDKYENEIFLYYIYKDTMISELTTVSSDTIHCFSNAEFMEESVVLEVRFYKVQTGIFILKTFSTMSLSTRFSQKHISFIVLSTESLSLTQQQKLRLLLQMT